MKLPPFHLERFFARHEFSALHLLCASDVEPYQQRELLALASREGRTLWGELSLGYTETAGHPRLRREIATLYDSIDPAEVLVFAGAEEAIFVVMNVVLRPGDHVVVTWPAYQSLFEIARAVGAEVDLLPLDPYANWEPDPDQLRALLRPNTRLVVINFPHNPTGALPSRHTFTEIVRLTGEAGAYLLSDEVYRFLEFEPGDRLPAAADSSPRATSLGVLSKAFGVPGIRIGWLATHDAELLARCAAFKDYTTICNSAPSEILGLIALQARDRVLARSREIIAANFLYLELFFERWHRAFEWVRPRGGTVAFPRLRSEMTVERFAADLSERTGVLILPGSIFDYAGNHFRIGFGRRNFPEALGELERFLVEHGAPRD